MLSSINKFITTYFRAFFVGAVVVALALPDQTKVLYRFFDLLFFLGMFLGGLEVNVHSMKEKKHKWKQLVMHYIICCILVPCVLYYTFGFINSAYGAWAFLLAAAPWGIAAIMLTRLVKWDSGWTLMCSLVSTFLTPLIFPGLTYLITWTTIAVDVLGMMSFLTVYLVLPILIAQVVVRYFARFTEKIMPYTWSLSILVCVFIIAWPLAENAWLFLNVSWMQLVVGILVAFAISILLFVGGWYGAVGGSREERIASAMSRGLMSISWATAVAAKFFPPEVLLVVLLYEFPRDVMLVPFRRVLEKRKK